MGISVLNDLEVLNRADRSVLEIMKSASDFIEETLNKSLEMQEVLEYNFQHFYGNFRKIITNELIDNFAALDTPAKLSAEYIEEVRNKLLQ